MRRYGFPVAIILMAGLLAISLARRAGALNHVKALRTGKLIIAVPQPSVFIPPQSDAGNGSGAHSDILPVLLRSPAYPAGMRIYSEAMKTLLPAVKSVYLEPYQQTIQTLDFAQRFLSVSREAMAQVVWIDGTDVLPYDGAEPIDTRIMRGLTSSSNKDAVAFVRPIVLFSPGLRRVYVVARVAVYAWGPVHSFFLGSTVLYTRTSLNDTTPGLRTNGVEGIAAGNQTGQAVYRARASVWFAHDAARLKQAIARDVKNLRSPLTGYLQGGS